MRITDLSESTKSTKYSLPPGLTPERFEGMLSHWGKIARYKESASIYYYGKPIIRLLQLTECPGLYKKYFGDKRVGYIDADQIGLEDEDEWDAFLKQEASGFDVLFILGAECLLHDTNKKVITTLENYLARGDRTYIFFYATDFTNPIFTPLFAGKTYFFQNIHIEPMLGEKDADMLMTQLCVWWDINISKRLRHDIPAHCGTHYLLIKQAVRTLRDTGTEEQLFNSDAMRYKIRCLWNAFLPSEQETIKYMLQGTHRTSDIHRHSSAFLTKAGWIQNGHLSIPLLETYVRTHELTHVLYLAKPDTLILGDIPINAYFSSKEVALLTLFLSRENTIVSRERIAETIWDDAWGEHYSDWAIDQTISRLRKKMNELSTAQYITTIRSQGFLLSSTQ